MDKNKHCGFCGTQFDSTAWPRECHTCGRTSYRNPTPVVICLQPVEDGPRQGLAIAQRAEQPRRGEWTLIAGHIEDNGETVEEAAAREFREETSVEPGDNYRLLGSAANGHGHLLLITEADPISYEDFQKGRPCHENLAIDVLWKPRDLAFPIHTQWATEWFERHTGERAAFRVNIKCSTRNEFDPHYTVWLIDPENPEDEIDVIFEDEEYRTCLRFCEEAGYTIVSGPHDD